MKGFKFFPLVRLSRSRTTLRSENHKTKMPVKLTDLDATSINIIKKVYQALLRAKDRLADVVDDYYGEDKLEMTLNDVENLCEKYPWLRQLAGAHH